MNAADPSDSLTLAERAVLRLVALGMTTREVAATLALSEKTVENRRCAIAQKLGLGGTRGLARAAIERAGRGDQPEPAGRTTPPDGAVTAGAAAPGRPPPRSPAGGTPPASP